MEGTENIETKWMINKDRDLILRRRKQELPPSEGLV